MLRRRLFIYDSPNTPLAKLTVWDQGAPFEALLFVIESSQEIDPYLNNSLWTCRKTWLGRNFDGIAIFFPMNFLK